MPSQMAVPWIQAMGNRIAPAIKKPHEAVLRQTTMCVIQEAKTQPIKRSGNSSSMMCPSFVFVFCLPIIQEALEHDTATLKFFLFPLFDDHEARLRD